MNLSRIGIILLPVCLMCISPSKAQVSSYKGKVSQQFVMNKESVIIDQSTGKRITYAAYDDILKRNPGKYRTQPVFDKYGQASSYALIRKNSGDIHANGGVVMNSDLMPEVGEHLPPFVMKGLDGKEYNSEKLKGKYILLGFWVKFEKPLYTLASTKIISNFIAENEKKGIEIISLGTTLNTEEECREAIPRRNCGFVPVPESYGFNHRYKIGETPYFILLDKNGIVKAMAPHTEFAATIGELSLK
ncbi:thioredoxin-like domain-containing protein [Dyadobacter sp. CY312]|uniref:TlpA family protein disulfide reductase n=1 Tax=Dyadobacter sp. CY312 TaxID=2907303 RepID=UPI001F39DB82|nr:thioredoxin-like domain-containing protein [Dyadobacter sp. CY312]MCE7039432.1 redoxin domain-containing protein [Dyadobacter sp. CY312]